jgi:SPP1 family predicted phage head-tail adaptor
VALMGLAAGSLRQRVTIRRQQRAADGQGGYTTSWADVATIWAKVDGLDGRESVIGQTLTGISVYRVTVRYRADILPSDQLRYGAIDLNIRSAIDPDGRRERTIITCDTGSAQVTA